MVGLSAPVLWTALGTFISHNSDMKEEIIHHMQCLPTKTSKF